MLTKEDLLRLNTPPLMNYIDKENFKLVEKLEIKDAIGNVIESISYALSKDAAE